MDNMDKIKHVYINQPFTISLDTKTDLSSATTIQIRYVKPGSDPVFKDASASGSTVSAQLTADEVDTVGTWEFRAWVEFGEGTGFVPGAPYQHAVEAV